MYILSTFRTREAELVRVAERHRLLREAREARKAERKRKVHNEAPRRAHRARGHDTEGRVSDPEPERRPRPRAA